MPSGRFNHPHVLDVDKAHLIYVAVELDSHHPVPVSWGAEDDATGSARVLMNGQTGEIYKMELVVEGISASGGENPLQSTPLQSFHFHNFPQIDNPDFFVEQLYDVDEDGAPVTATLENTLDGFEFRIEDTYQLRDPVNNPELDVDFVVGEILAGNGYLGVHTAALPIPATAIAGDMVVLSSGGLDGMVLYFGDENDSGIGSRNGDLISGGGGNDVIRGLNGNDVLDGGIGDDVLVGGRGNDLLRGGMGNDTFVYKTRAGTDTIVDFELGEDAILLKGRARDYDLTLTDADDDGHVDDTRLTTRDGWIDILDTDLVGVSEDAFLA